MTKDEIYPSDTRRFVCKESKLTKEDLTGLQPLFCIGSLRETRCLSASDRTTQITAAGKEYLNQPEKFEIATVDHWNAVLPGAKVLLVHTNDPEKDYKIREARVRRVNNPMYGCPYYRTSVDLEVDGQGLNNISPGRIFIPAKNYGKKSTLNVNAPEFIPQQMRK
jgi:hypothetical protein